MIGRTGLYQPLSLWHADQKCCFIDICRGGIADRMNLVKKSNQGGLGWLGNIAKFSFP